MNIIIAGDYCPQLRAEALIDKGDFESVLGNVRDVLSKSDYSIVNFESTISKGNEKPIKKSGPNLQCSEKGIEALKWAGFDCVTLANNHFLDYGEQGVLNTIEACDKYSIETVGGGLNLQQVSQIYYKTVCGEKLGIINCCEHEFSIATECSAGSNPLNIIQQFYSIKESKSKADYVIVIVHGGNEHYQLPSPRMKEIYRFFIDAGADAVINHHQHCFSGYEVYKEKPIFYGLGNFCFDHPTNRNGIWNEGYMVELSLTRNSKVGFVLWPYVQCNDNANIELLKDDKKQVFEERIKVLCGDILNDRLLKEKYEKWVEGGRKWIMSLFEPFITRLARGLYYRNLCPSFLKGERLYLLENYLFCEAHFDQVKYVLSTIERNKKDDTKND